MTNVDFYVGMGFSPGKLGKQNFIVAVADSQSALIGKDGSLIPYQNNAQKLVNIGPYIIAAAGDGRHFHQLAIELYEAHGKRNISDVEELADCVVDSMKLISGLEPTVDCIVAGQDKKGTLRAIAVDLNGITDYTSRSVDIDSRWIKHVALRTGNVTVERDYLPHSGEDAIEMNIDMALAIAYRNAMSAARRKGVNDKLQFGIAEKSR